MKAVGYTQPSAITDEYALVDIEIEKPTPQGRDLLVSVQAISVNPVDTKVRGAMGPLTGDDYRILGWDAVGVVEQIGPAVENFKVGDCVWYAGDLTRRGSNAEHQLVDERIVAIKPIGLSNAEAAALPLTAITAWELLFDRLNFSLPQYAYSTKVEKSKDTLLIIGAAGGVGSILTQLAANLTNVTVIGTASRAQSKQWVKNIGADHVIDHHEPFAKQLKSLGIDSVSYVISLNQTDKHYDQIVEVIAPQGKFALIDDPSETLDIKKLKSKSISLHWEFMFTRSMFHTDDLSKQGELLTKISDLIDQGIIKTTFGENLGNINAKNLKLAHQKIEDNNVIGKIVLEGF